MRAQILGTCGSASYRPAMAYTDVPSAVGTLRPAAAPRLALAAPQPDRRRALELLATCRDGCIEALMLGNGFPVEMLVELIRTGLASVEAERMVAGGKQIEVARVRITEAGRRALRL
jgi:hypothetical protein